MPFLSQQSHRPRPVESVVDELESLEQDYVYFSDDENFINKKFSWELAEAIEARGIKKRYFAWTRATTVNRSPDLLKKWHNIGLDSAFIGFEFINDEELKASSKACTVAANEKALDTLRAMDVVVHAAFIIRSEYTADEFEKLRGYVQAMPPSQCSAKPPSNSEAPPTPVITSCPPAATTEPPSPSHRPRLPSNNSAKLSAPF